MPSWMALSLVCLLLSCSSVGIAQTSEEQDSPLLFTIQPPSTIPCNPYQGTANTMLRLQCTVHAPNLNLYLPEKNFTIDWLRKSHESDDLEETISVSSSPVGLHVDNERSFYVYTQDSTTMGEYVTSVLSFDLAVTPQDHLPGLYWCRVLVKTLRNYSYSVAGRSNTQTVILSSAEYNSGVESPPPCVSDSLFYQTWLKSVYDTEIIASPRDLSAAEGGSVFLPSGVLVAVAITGGALIVMVMILVLVVIYSCKTMNEKKTDFQRNRVSMQSTETQEDEVTMTQKTTKSYQPHPQPHPHQQSLPRPNSTHAMPLPFNSQHHSNSYRVKTKQQLPHTHGHYRGESFSNDSAFFNGRVKSTGSNNSMLA